MMASIQIPERMEPPKTPPPRDTPLPAPPALNAEPMDEGRMTSSPGGQNGGKNNGLEQPKEKCAPLPLLPSTLPPAFSAMKRTEPVMKKDVFKEKLARGEQGMEGRNDYFDLF